MTAVSEWVGLIGGIAGIAVLLTSAFVFTKGSYNKARIEALRDDNNDLRARVEDLEGDLERSKTKEAVLEAKVNSLVNENQLLTALVTQRAQVEELTGVLSNHHREAMMAWSEIKEALARL